MSARSGVRTGFLWMFSWYVLLAMSASAQTPPDPLPQWRISADVAMTQFGGGTTDTTEASYVEQDAQSGAFTWTGSRTGSSRGACPVSGFAGYDVEGSGTGTGHFDALVATGPDYWGLPTDRSYSVVRTVSQGDFALTSTTYNCNGESETGPAGSQGPYEAVIYLEGTPEELAALPVGTKRQLTYSHTDPGESTVKTIISYTATKEAVPPPPLPACGDEIDNDRDGTVDYGNDPGCTSFFDTDERGLTVCDNGVDDDGDGLFDAGKDPGNDPDCTGPEDADERAPCGRLRSALPGYVARFAGRSVQEAQYEGDIYWCTDGQRVELRSVSVTATTRPDGGRVPAWLKALERGLRAVADIEVEWKAKGEQWRLLPGDAQNLRVELRGGRFAACHGVPVMGTLAKLLKMPALKTLMERSKPVRHQFARIIRPMLHKKIEHNFRRATAIEEDRIVDKLLKQGIDKAAARAAAREQARITIGAWEDRVHEAINKQLLQIVESGNPLRFCWTLWRPEVTVTMTADGTQSWSDLGARPVPELWEIEQVR